MLTTRAFPTLLHLIVMVNENYDEFRDGPNDRQREECVFMLLQLLPKVRDQLEIPDHSGRSISVVFHVKILH